MSTTTCCPGAGVSEEGPGPPISPAGGPGPPKRSRGPVWGRSLQDQCPPPAPRSSSWAQAGRRRLLAQSICGGLGEARRSSLSTRRASLESEPLRRRSGSITINLRVTFRWRLKAAGRNRTDRACNGPAAASRIAQGQLKALLPAGPDALAHSCCPAATKPLGRERRLGFSKRPTRPLSSGPGECLYGNVGHHLGWRRAGANRQRVALEQAENGDQTAKRLGQAHHQVRGRAPPPGTSAGR